MGRAAADVVARWPVTLIDLLIDYLEVGDASDHTFWLALGLACTEKKPPTEGMIARAELMIGQMPMSDALLWTIRAKEAGHADGSLLRRRATSNLFGPRDRVLAAALALQHAGDAGADPLLQAAAAECDPDEFPKLLADLSSLAAGAIPSLVSGASTTEDRAQAMVAALRDAGIVARPRVQRGRGGQPGPTPGRAPPALGTRAGVKSRARSARFRHTASVTKLRSVTNCVVWATTS